MRIKCGKCSTRGNAVYHESVAAVRECQLGSTTVARTGPSAPTPTVPSPRSGEMDWSVPGYTGVRVDLSELEGRMIAGRFAVEMQDDRLHFFQVDRPEDGRWAGYTFIKEQASDNLFAVKSPARRKLIMEAILKVGLGEAMLRYGLELGKCGHCGRTLTNQESREAGIGPICRGKMPSGFFN